MIRAERNARVMAEANVAVVKAEAANAQADLSSSEALNAHLKLEIEKLRRELYGSRSERKARLLEQMELQLEDLETAATEDELAAETTAVRTQAVQSFQRKRPATTRVCMTSESGCLTMPAGVPSMAMPM